MSDNLVILMAEDEDAHARLVEQRFETIGVKNKIVRFRDGQEAWEFLSGTGLKTGGEYLMLLDIRMPGIDGIELLGRIKAEERLKNMPVIMLTTTDDPKDVEACYKAGCNNYLTKPVDFEKFAEVIKRLGLFLLVVKVGKVK